MEVINCMVHDLRPYLYSRSERESITLFKCNNTENCDAYKNGQCIMCILGAFAIPLSCPYGTRTETKGYTKRSKMCGKMIDEAKQQYADCMYILHDKVPEFCQIGDYIYIKLHHLKNYVNPILNEANAASEFLIHQDTFTPEFIVKLIQYQPRSSVGGVIESYQEKEIPRFIQSMRTICPNMYTEIQKIYPEVDKL